MDMYFHQDIEHYCFFLQLYDKVHKNELTPSKTIMLLYNKIYI